MSTPIKPWLCDQFVEIDSVRSAKINGEGVIVVHSWSGTIIYVYLIDQPIKARAIKRIVGENTRVGIGTLFIVSGELVPEDGTKVIPDEGLVTLHALFKDKFYTYRLQDGAPRIGQVHFKNFSRGDEREIWYGPDVKIRHLPSFRVWVNAPQAIKGNWLIASFGSEAFWNQADYSAGRASFRQQQRRSTGKTQFFTFSKPGWMNGGSTYTTPASPPPRRETELDRSYHQLGLTPTASSEEVKAAFRRLAREVHPDVSHLPKDEAEARFNKLYAAYSFIKSANGW